MSCHKSFCLGILLGKEENRSDDKGDNNDRADNNAGNGTTAESFVVHEFANSVRLALVVSLSFAVAWRARSHFGIIFIESICLISATDACASGCITNICWANGRGGLSCAGV